MADQRSLTVQAVALKILSDRVAARRVEVNRALAESMVEGDRSSARLDSGVAVGAVTFTKGSSKARVVNETQLLQWVIAEHPDQIMQAIRPAYLAELLTVAVKHGEAVTQDGEPFPGVQVVESGGYISVRPDTEKIPELLEAIRGNYDLALAAGNE